MPPCRYDELLARRDLGAHQQLEDLRGGLRVVDGEAAQGATARVHRRLGQLVGVHLPEPLVALRGVLPADVLLLQLGELAVQLVVGVGVDVLVHPLAGVGQLDAVQRRHGGEHAAGGDQLGHVLEEQRREQAADVGAVGVGVGHEDDLAVARRVDVEGAPGAGPDHLDDRPALGVLEHVAHRRLLDVEDLAADRQQRLELRVAGELGGAERGVALHDEQLGAVVGGPAVGELGGQRRGLQGVLAALGLLVLARGDAGLGRAGDLLHHQLGLGLLDPLGRGEERLHLGGDDLAHHRAHLRGAEDLLGLALELGLGLAHRHHRGHALDDVVLGDGVVVDLEDLGGPHHVVEGLEQPLLEAADVRAALGGGDDVDERAQLGVVAGPPPHRDVDAELALDLLRRHVAVGVEHGHRLGEGAAALQAQDVGDRLVLGEEVDELADAAVVAELLLHHLGAAQVTDHQLEAGHDERRLPGAAEQPLVDEVGVLGEDLPVRPEPDPGAAAALGDPTALAGQTALGRERRPRALAVEDPRHAVLERQPLDGGRALHVDVHARREGVDHGQADAVQTTGGDVRAAAELAAGVQLGRHHLDAREPGAWLLVGRDAAAVVVHLDRVVGVEGDLDPVRRAGEGLVDAVVDDLPQAVHQPAGVGGADVHARALAHRLQALEDQQVRGVVGGVDRSLLASVPPRCRLGPSGGGCGSESTVDTPGGPGGTPGRVASGPPLRWRQRQRRRGPDRSTSPIRTTRTTRTSSQTAPRVRTALFSHHPGYLGHTLVPGMEQDRGGKTIRDWIKASKGERPPGNLWGPRLRCTNDTEREMRPS